LFDEFFGYFLAFALSDFDFSGVELVFCFSFVVGWGLVEEDAGGFDWPG